jgi:aryl-alcohol dehydrogenase-like predicted oxidoreductase
MKKLGNTGLIVSEICLGTMTFSDGEGRWTAVGRMEQSLVDDLIWTSIDRGASFFDTANVYSEGVSEMMTGRAIRSLGLVRDSYVLAWLLHQPHVTSVIIGARTREQLLDNIGATGVVLSATEQDQLDKASALPAEYPGWMLERIAADRLALLGGRS